MAALLAALSVLALRGAPTIAMRDSDFDLENGFGLQGFDGRNGFDERGGFNQVAAKAALARRANTGTDARAGTQANSMDSALVAKEADSPSVCVCIGTQAGWSKNYVNERVIPSSTCIEKGRYYCHNSMNNYVDGSSSSRLSSDAVATSCSNGKLECLNWGWINEHGQTGTVKKGVRKIKSFDASNNCLTHCKCSDSSEQAFCVDPWRWGWFVDQDLNCNRRDVGVGSCTFEQQFELKEKGGAYEGKFTRLIMDENNQLKVNVQVLKFEAPSSRFYRTCAVTVDLGKQRSFTAFLNSVTSAEWLWDVADSKGRVRLSVYQRKGTGPVKGSSWQVRTGTGDATKYKYWAIGEKDTLRDSQGYEFIFSPQWEEFERPTVAKLERKFSAEVKDGVTYRKNEYFRLTVSEGEDAGLLLLASVLIDKAYSEELPTTLLR